ncbi:M91 family zinc metallopeptidase [Candidatus Pantoea communis]|uniref:M91 family zinc metallopeptidase n=1 Tax=Pantoea TaxID=53335 RepID=UPI00141A2A90
MPLNFLPYKSNSINAPFITINYENNRDLDETEKALKKIASTHSGKNLLLSLKYVATEEKNLIIVANNQYPTGTAGYLSKSQIRKYYVNPDVNSKEHQTAMRLLSTVDRDGKHSEGTPSIITFNPNESSYIDNEGFPVKVYSTAYNPASLTHELIHAFHQMNGTSLTTHPDKVWFNGTGQRREEERAVGIGEFEREAFSENTVRRELKMPVRKSYFNKSMPPKS